MTLWEAYRMANKRRAGVDVLNSWDWNWHRVEAKRHPTGAVVTTVWEDDWGGREHRVAPEAAKRTLVFLDECDESRAMTAAEDQKQAATAARILRSIGT